MPPELVDKREERIKSMFGAIAPRYDLLNHLLSLNVDTYWRWRTTRLAPAKGDGPILDLCTGTGDLAFAYYKAGHGKIEVVGADFCHEMLVRACAKTARRKLQGKVRFLEADAQRLPFPDDTFQLTCVAFGLRNVTNTARGLSEMARVTKPGGTVAVLEFSRPKGWFFGRMYRLYFTRLLPRIGSAMARGDDSAYHYLPASVLEFPDGEALAEMMRQHGLTDVRWHPFTFGIATLYVGVKARR